jgi:hypothetical protein
VEGVGLDPFHNPLIQTFLTTLSQEVSVSKAQQDTFAWKQHSDVIVSDDTLTEECDEDGFHPIPSGLDVHPRQKAPTVNSMKKQRNAG